MEITDNNNDPRPTGELVRAALLETDEEEYWKLIYVLQKRATREVFDAARSLCSAESVDEKILGADILGQLGSPNRAFPDEAVDVLLELLAREKDPKILTSAAFALSHNDVAKKVEPLIQLRNHPDAEVRFAVVMGLLWRPEERAITAMMEFMQDEDEDVRNWATFAVGKTDEVDSPEIREALLGRVNDEFDAVRGEALRGLAIRGDERVIEPLIHELLLIAEVDEWWDYAFEAAEVIADTRLYPALMAVKESGVEDRSLEHAIALCRIPSPGESGDAPDDAFTTCPVCGLRNAFTNPDEFEFCSRCGWENDEDQRADPDLIDSCYGRSLNQERERWRKRVETSRQQEK